MSECPANQSSRWECPEARRLWLSHLLAASNERHTPLFAEAGIAARLLDQFNAHMLDGHHDDEELPA